MKSMNSTLVRGLLASVIVVSISACGVFQSGSNAKMDKKAQLILVEAEAITKEMGGKVMKRSDRQPVSGGQCISNWDDKDHTLEWSLDVPVAGSYNIVMRYASARAWNVYRDIKIDGKNPDAALAKVALAPTGGWGKKPTEWKALAVKDGAGKPVAIELSAGTHVLSINNLGGDNDQNGSGNFDVIALVPVDMDLDKVAATLGVGSAK